MRSNTMVPREQTCSNSKSVSIIKVKNITALYMINLLLVASCKLQHILSLAADDSYVFVNGRSVIEEEWKIEKQLSFISYCFTNWGRIIGLILTKWTTESILWNAGNNNYHHKQPFVHLYILYLLARILEHSQLWCSRLSLISFSYVLFICSIICLKLGYQSVVLCTQPDTIWELENIILTRYGNLHSHSIADEFRRT